MIAEFGHFVLVLALAVALVQAIAPAYLMQRDTALALPLARRATRQHNSTGHQSRSSGGQGQFIL